MRSLVEVAAVLIPVTHWRARAACRGQDPELFYADTPDAVARARQVCAGCPVRRDCLSSADSHGMWGGQTPDERGAEPAPVTHMPADDPAYAQHWARQRKRPPLNPDDIHHLAAIGYTDDEIAARLQARPGAVQYLRETTSPAGVA